MLSSLLMSRLRKRSIDVCLTGQHADKGPALGAHEKAGEHEPSARLKQAATTGTRQLG